MIEKKPTSPQVKNRILHMTEYVGGKGRTPAYIGICNGNMQAGPERLRSRYAG
jgi:hypothetical protein